MRISSIHSAILVPISPQRFCRMPLSHLNQAVYRSHCARGGLLTFCTRFGFVLEVCEERCIIRMRSERFQYQYLAQNTNPILKADVAIRMNSFVFSKNQK